MRRLMTGCFANGILCCAFPKNIIIKLIVLQESYFVMKNYIHYCIRVFNAINLNAHFFS